MVAWMYADNAELDVKNYRWWRDGNGESRAHGDTAHERLLFFWRTHQVHIPDSENFFTDLFEHKVRVKPRIDGLHLEAWKACFARLVNTYKRDIRRDLMALRSRHYRQLIQAVQKLECALSPFGELWQPEAYFEIGGAPMTSDELIDWAENKLARRQGGGRPDVRVFERVVIDLLALYVIVFRRRPSYATQGGSTMRYVNAFFGLVVDSFTTEFGDLSRLPSEMSKRPFKLLQPSDGAIREMVRRAIPKISDTTAPGWMTNIGLFADDLAAEQPPGKLPSRGQTFMADPGNKQEKKSPPVGGGGQKVVHLSPEDLKLLNAAVREPKSKPQPHSEEEE